MTIEIELGVATLIITVLVGLVSVWYARTQTKLAKLNESRAKAEEDRKRSQIEIERTSEFIGKFDEVLQNVAEVEEKINKIIESEFKDIDEITVLNFGLDLETVAPWLKNHLIVKEKYFHTKINFKGLIIDPDSAYIKPLIDEKSNLKSSIVASSIENLNSIEHLNLKNIFVEIRSYQLPPIFHGFIINGKHLFLGFTEVEENKVHGGLSPYIYVRYDSTSKLNVHYFRMFKTWFDYIWNNSTQKVVINK